MKKCIIPLNCLWALNNSQLREKNNYLILYDFNTVDRNDRDNSDNTTTMQTNRWYLHFFFWIFDHFVHVVFVVACFCVKFDVGPPGWISYLNKNGGQETFQIDLGMQLLNYAIGKAWSDMYTPPPDWMQQSKFIPCDCTKCFFCLNALTNGSFTSWKSRL